MGNLKVMITKGRYKFSCHSTLPVYTIVDISSTYVKYSTVLLGGKVYGSTRSRAKSTSIVLAELEIEIRPTRINYFAKISAVIDGNSHNQVMVCLSWFKHHMHKDICGKPVTV